MADSVHEIARLNLVGRYSIDYASTQKQALEMIKINKYDIVVTDLYLGPRCPKGGLRVIKAAKERGLKAVLMSMENHRKEARAEGVRFMFKKQLPNL